MSEVSASHHSHGRTPGRTSYVREGAGVPVILIHGVGMNAEIWRPQITALTRKFDVIAYDMLGHGSSKVPPEDSSLADFADQLEELRSSLKIERAHLVGHSLGALIAIEYALAFPKRVLSVSALNAVFMRSPEQRRAIEERAFGLNGLKHDTASNEQAILRWFGDPVPDHLAAHAQLARHALQIVDPMGYRRTYRLFASSDDAHKERLQNLRPRALFMTGEGDPNSTPEMSLRMSRIAPRASCEILQGERHMMPLTASHAVIERLIRFFEADAENLSPTYGLGSAQA